VLSSRLIPLDNKINIYVQASACRGIREREREREREGGERKEGRKRQDALSGRSKAPVPSPDRSGYLVSAGPENHSPTAEGAGGMRGLGEWEGHGCGS